MFKLSVRATLLSILAVLTIIIGGQGLFSLQQISTVNSHAVAIATNWLPSVDAIRQLAYESALYRAEIATHVITTDEKAMAKIEAQIKASKITIENAKQHYEKLISSPEELTLYKHFEQLWSEHEALTPKVLDASRANRNEEARDLFTGTQAEIYRKVVQDLEGLTKINVDGSQLEATQSTASYSAARIFTLAVIAIALVIAIGAGILVLNYIAKPLNALVGPLEIIAGGNFAIAVPGVGRKDEIGQIADAVQRMAEKISTTIGEIKASGREVTNASAEISTSTSDLSQRTEEQAASLEQTSAAMEELAATVRKNAESAQLANTDANMTRDVADRGGKVVAQAVEAMAKIEDSSRKISDIIGVIDEIARQTNLLALNAAVEAARAGEAGRGFAVVASEVRSLAQRSSQAAKDIKDLITNSNGQVKDGVELVNKAGESLTEIVDSIKKVAAVVSDIANASIEQATGIDQINKALNQMDEVTQQNSALVEENAATAKTLEHQAQAMDEQVSFFQIAVGDDSHGYSRAAPQRAASAPPARRSAPAAAPKRVAAKPSQPARRAAASPGPARTMQTALAKAVNSDDWQEF